MQGFGHSERIKKITKVSLIVSLSLILSYFDILISRAIFPFLPTAKIGLANIFVVFAIYHMDFKEALVISLMKSLMSLMLGNVIGFLISIFASVISFFGMYGSYLLLKKIASPISISVIGGFLHIIGQLFMVQLIYRIGNSLLFYSAFAIFVSLITSILIGIISLYFLNYMNNKNS